MYIYINGRGKKETTEERGGEETRFSEREIARETRHGAVAGERERNAERDGEREGGERDGKGRGRSAGRLAKKNSLSPKEKKKNSLEKYEHE